MSDFKNSSYVVFKHHDEINYQMIYIVIGTEAEIMEFQKTMLKPDKYNPVKAKGALDRIKASSLLEYISPQIRHMILYINKDKCRNRMTRTLYHELLHLYDAVHHEIYLGGVGPEPSKNELLVRVMTSLIFDTELGGAWEYATYHDQNYNKLKA